MTGCQSRAHRDVYHRKMANEIRVLEDQLYDADYQNRVLRDKLERERAIPSRSMPQRRKDRIDPSYGPAVEPAPISDPPLRDESVSPAETFDEESIDQLIDPGEPIAPDQNDSDSKQASPDDSPAPVPTPEPDAEEGERSEAGSEAPAEQNGDASSLLPAPGLPEPPGEEDLSLPPIVPGEILPPPRPGDEPEKPPGQVELPESLQTKKQLPPASEPPQKLSIHPGISGGHQFDEDDQVDGLFVVVNALDRNDRMVDLSAFEIDAKLTIVVLDPALPSSEARIGRWEFDAEQVSGLLRSHPVSGLHVPIKWQDTTPLGDDVIVHVRLMSDDEEMRCESRLRVDRSVANAKWTPRGEPIRR